MIVDELIGTGTTEAVAKKLAADVTSSKKIVTRMTGLAESCVRFGIGFVTIEFNGVDDNKLSLEVNSDGVVLRAESGWLTSQTEVRHTAALEAQPWDALNDFLQGYDSDFSF